MDITIVQDLVKQIPITKLRAILGRCYKQRLKKKQSFMIPGCSYVNKFDTPALPQLLAYIKNSQTASLILLDEIQKEYKYSKELTLQSTVDDILSVKTEENTYGVIAMLLIKGDDDCNKAARNLLLQTSEAQKAKSDNESREKVEKEIEALKADRVALSQLKKEHKDTTRALKKAQNMCESLKKGIEQLRLIKEKLEKGLEEEKRKTEALLAEKAKLLSELEKYKQKEKQLQKTITSYSESMAKKIPDIIKTKIFILGIGKLPEDFQRHFEITSKSIIDETEIESVIANEEIWVLNSFVTLKHQRILNKLENIEHRNIQYFDNMSELQLYARAKIGGNRNGLQ